MSINWDSQHDIGTFHFFAYVLAKPVIKLSPTLQIDNFVEDFFFPLVGTRGKTCSFNI